MFDHNHPDYHDIGHATETATLDPLRVFLQNNEATLLDAVTLIDPADPIVETLCLLADALDRSGLRSVRQRGVSRTDLSAGRVQWA